MRIKILGIFIALVALGGIAAADPSGTVTLGGTVNEVVTLTITQSGTTNFPINPTSDTNPAGTATVTAITNLRSWQVDAKWIYTSPRSYNGHMGALDGTNFYTLEKKLQIFIGGSSTAFTLPDSFNEPLIILTGNAPTSVSGTQVDLRFNQPGSMNDRVKKADGSYLDYSLPMNLLLWGAF
jgi:hypothetical protein